MVIYLMAPFFFILLFYGDRAFRSCSLVIFISCALNLMTDVTVTTGLPLIERERLFIYETNVSILWDAACVLLLITSKLFSQESGKQALLLSFAVLCHIMVAYDIVDFFRTWYVELIILVGILQMMVVWNGFIAAFIRFWKSMSRFLNYFSRRGKGILERKKAEERL